MNKDFVPYNESLELKELGFDEPCLAVHYPNKFYFYSKNRGIKNSNKISQSWICTAPTFSQAFRWFREKYELSCSIELTDNSRHYYFDFTIYDSKNRDYNDEDCFDSCKRIYDDGKFGTYEESELACLQKLIQIVKNEKHTHTTN